MKTVSKIKRKSDNKIFGCYFRNNIVTTNKSDFRSDWIEENGNEELELFGVDINKYEILEEVEIDKSEEKYIKNHGFLNRELK